MTASAGTRIAATALALVLLAGCATNHIGAEGIKSFYCGDGSRENPGAYKPVLWSQKDTTETIIQNKANNAVWIETCR